MMEQFERTTELELRPMSAGSIAEQEGVSIDLKPERFAVVEPALWHVYRFIAHKPNSHTLE